jgi:kynurenine formamidase
MRKGALLSVAFLCRWVGGDGCIVRLVATDDPTGGHRIETGRAS